MDVSASKTFAQAYCQILSAVRVEIREKLTGVKKSDVRQTDLWRHEWLAGVFTPISSKKGEMDGVGET